MTSKIKIRVGHVEIDCEGSEKFLKSEVPALMKAAIELAKIAPADAADGAANRERTGQIPRPKINSSPTATSIAARLRVRSGTDLVKAAAARLALVANEERFSRDQLVSEMRNAGRYYKNSYLSNLTTYIAKAISDGVLVETFRNIYALTGKAREELGASLADRPFVRVPRPRRVK